ncbi:MAG TPA: ABC transporter permease, partial [Gemmatimonadaceae bacterium]
MTSALVRWWRVALARCRALVRPQTVRDEIEEELRFHIDMRAQELVRNGVSPADARRAAAQSFGSVSASKDVSYDIRGGGPLESLWRDIEYGMPSIRSHAALSAVVIGVVAIGVGANAAILGVADRVLWRELPVRAPHELVRLTHYKDVDAASYPLYRAMQADTGAFSGVLARWRQTSSFAVGNDALERRVVELVSGDYFSLLGVRPALGRLLSAADDKTIMGHAVVVVSDRYWRTRFGGDESVIGKTIRIDDYPLKIVGVAPPEFTGVEVGVIPDAWVPLAMHPVIFSAHRSLVDDSWMWLDVIGRLAPGVSLERAHTSAALSLQRFLAASGEPIPKAVPRVMRLRPVSRGLSALREQMEGSLDVLVGLAGLVLLIACANLATLLAIRSIARSKEIGVRLALGASHGRVVRQLFLESMLLALAGGAIGTALAVRGASLLLPFLPPSVVPSEIAIAPDARTLVISLVLTLATGVLFGIGPALRGIRVDVASVIRDEIHAQTGRRRFGLRRALVGGQVALSLVLVIGAGLFARSLVRLAATPAGFDVDRVIVASVEPSLNRYGPDDAIAIYRLMHARLAALPGVQRVGMSDIELLGGPDHYNIRPLRVPGTRRPETGWESLTITTNGDFFAATGIDVVRGRVFDARDTRDAPLAVVL